MHTIAYFHTKVAFFMNLSYKHGTLKDSQRVYQSRKVSFKYRFYNYQDVLEGFSDSTLDFDKEVRILFGFNVFTSHTNVVWIRHRSAESKQRRIISGFSSCSNQGAHTYL
jgi:hypothetical protein